MKLSVALATFNEETNLAKCLGSVSSWADEIVIVDGGSTDGTLAIARTFSARVIEADNPPVFHINKEKALDACRGEWILQLDADEVVPPELAAEIRTVISLADQDIEKRPRDRKKQRLFERHQKLIEHRDGKIGDVFGEVAAFFIPRRNYFLGKPMTYAGMYPDGVIRLVKRGKARFPQESVHEQIQVDGKVSWLTNDLLHFSNPTLGKYIAGADKYTDLMAGKIRGSTFISAFSYFFLLPVSTFVSLFIRHKGILDGFHGFLFSIFSALHYPVAYGKFIRKHMRDIGHA